MFYTLAQQTQLTPAQQQAADQLALFAGTFLVIYLFVVAAIFIVGAVIACFICKRLGHTPWWGLLYLVPVVNIFLPLWWAFAESPNEKKIHSYRRQLQQMKRALEQAQQAAAEATSRPAAVEAAPVAALPAQPVPAAQPMRPRAAVVPPPSDRAPRQVVPMQARTPKAPQPVARPKPAASPQRSAPPQRTAPQQRSAPTPPPAQHDDPASALEDLAGN